jgi:hypothetical protein
VIQAASVHGSCTVRRRLTSYRLLVLLATLMQGFLIPPFSEGNT